MKFADWVKETGLSRKDVGRILGCTESAVNMWIRGERIPSEDFIIKINHASNGLVEPNDWFEGVVKKQVLSSHCVMTPDTPREKDSANGEEAEGASAARKEPNQ